MPTVVFKVLSEGRDISLKQAEGAVGGVTQAIVAAHPGADMLTFQKSRNQLCKNQRRLGDKWSPTRQMSIYIEVL